MRAAAELNAVDAVRGRPGARVHLSCSLEEEQTALTVADNGPGLPADRRTRSVRVRSVSVG